VREKALQLGMPALEERGPAEARRRAEKQLRPVLDRMIDDALVLQQATELKLNVTDAEVTRGIDEIKKQNNLDDEQFIAALAQQGFTKESYHEEMRRQLVRLKVINTAVRSHINVTDEDVRAFYDQSSRKAGGKREAHVRHVLLTIPAGAAEKVVAERRLLGAKIVEEARAGKDFAELVKKHSEDEGTRDKAGDLGWLSDADGLAENLADVVFSMDKGEVRGPIRTDRGYEIVQVVERKESSNARPFDEVKDSIRQQLYGQQMEKQTQSWLQELKKKAHIDIRL
jgi:peptidyl-prolyl cis-trans isomerase SurA